MRKICQTENVPQTAHHVAGASQGAIFQLPLPSGGQTKGTLKDLEIPESVGCGNSLRERARRRVESGSQRR